MADNTVLNAGSGGDTIADEDIGGVKYQIVKLALGVHGENDGDLSSSNPMPVQMSGAASLGSGQTMVPTGTGAALPANPCRWVTLRASIGNTAPVYLGSSGVTTTTGFELQPGDAITLGVANTNLLTLIAGVASQTVSWLWTD